MKPVEKTISIVTPSFNQGKYIEETIKSVLSQEGDFHIDYIIMDGGSTDESVEIIRRYADLVVSGKWETKCSGVSLKWASKKDNGQTDAINKGFHQAKGGIVSWINSDDMYSPGAFANVMEHFSKHPNNDFVYGDGDVVDEHGNIQWEWLSRPYNLKLLKSYHFLWNDFTNYIMQQATFWRRRVFDMIGLLDESFHYAMDIEYWIRAGANGLRLAHIPVKLGKFRMISGTKSLSSATAFWPESMEIFRRYNGSHAMKPFFVYYFYSVGVSNDFDTDDIIAKKESLLRRWSHLPPEEQQVLSGLAEKAFYIACLKLANEAFLRGEASRAGLLYGGAVEKRGFLILHPLSAVYLLKRVAGRRLTSGIHKYKVQLINQYRKRMYLYRYIKRG